MMARTNIMDFSLPISNFSDYTSNAVLLQGLFAVFLIFFNRPPVAAKRMKRDNRLRVQSA